MLRYLLHSHFHTSPQLKVAATFVFRIFVYYIPILIIVLNFFLCSDRLTVQHCITEFSLWPDAYGRTHNATHPQLSTKLEQPQRYQWIAIILWLAVPTRRLCRWQPWSYEIGGCSSCTLSQRQLFTWSDAHLPRQWWSSEFGSPAWRQRATWWRWWMRWRAWRSSPSWTRSKWESGET